jgi:hypothetical protein
MVLGVQSMPKAFAHGAPDSGEAGMFNISLTHRSSQVAGRSIV